MPYCTPLLRLLAICLIALTTVSTGCSSSPKPDEKPTEKPDYSKDPVLRVAQHISSRADWLLVFESPEAVVKQTKQLVDASKRRVSGGAYDMPVDIISQQLRVDIQDIETWKKTGIRTDSAFFLAFRDEDDPVLVVELADEKKFTSFLKNFYGDSGLQDDEWVVRNKVAYVALGDKDALTLIDMRDDAFATTSLAEDEGFRTFRKQTLRNKLAGLYVPRGSEIMGAALREFVHEFGSSYRGPFSRHILWGATGQIQGFGIAADVEGGEVRAKAWLGLPKEVSLKLGKVIASPRPQGWEQFILDDAVLVSSTSIAPQRAWDWMSYAFHPEVREDGREAFAELEKERGVKFDIEKDLVAHLTGESALAIYPLEKGAPRYAAFADDGFGAVFFFTMTDPVVPKHLAGLIQKGSGRKNRPGATVRLAKGQGTGGTVRVVDFGRKYSPKLYFQGTTVAMASNAFDEAKIVEMFVGSDRSNKLSNHKDRSLAQRMLSSVQDNVLYLNGKPFFAKLRENDPNDEDIAPWAELLEEALITARITDDGIVASGTMRSAAALGLIPRVINKELLDDKLMSARSTLSYLSRHMQRYVGYDQRGCSNPRTCDHPWNAEVSNQNSVRLPSSNFVFPGGLNQEWKTHASVPQAGLRMPWKPTARQFTEATTDQLRAGRPTSTSFRFTIVTNGVRGPGAQAIIRAEADFNPRSPEYHTFEQTLTIEADGRVNTSKIVETNRFE